MNLSANLASSRGAFFPKNKMKIIAKKSIEEVIGGSFQRKKIIMNMAGLDKTKSEKRII